MKKITTLFFCLLLIQISMAQVRIITGQVLSADVGSGLPGASVVVSGTNIGTSTDADGKFEIKVSNDDKYLTVTFVGMETKEVRISSDEMTIELEPEKVDVGEIVVTANAIKREKRELGYSVETVSGEKVSDVQESNLINSLAGKVAGVQTISQSGDIGGSSRIIIRGINSFSGSNQPLFVIDGVPIDNQAVNGPNNQVDGGYDVGNRAQDINPDDIESISVLKGGAAAALYGSRARDGVIIITTKRGARAKSGKKATVAYSGAFTWNSPLILPNFQNEYGPGTRGKYDKDALNGWGPRIDKVVGEDFVNYNGDTINLQAYPDNVKNFYETGFTMQNSIDVSGADENGDYRVGYTNLDQKGIIPGSELQRNTFTFNAGKDWGKIKPRVSVSYVKSTSIGRGARGGNNNNVLSSIINFIPRTTSIDEIREYQNPDGTHRKLNDWQNNPYWVTNKNTFSNEIDRLYGNVQLDYLPFSWLTVQGRLGTDMYREWRRQIIAKGSSGNENGRFADDNLWNQEMNSDLMATITKEIFDDLELKVILGHNVNQRSYRRMSNEAQELEVDGLYNYPNASTNTPTQYSEIRRLWGVYADVSLNFKSYLYLNMTARNDHSSTLPEENNSYFYPSASLSFILTDAFPTLQNKFFSYGKMRANIAKVGSDEDPYQLEFNYQPRTSSWRQYIDGMTFPHAGFSAFRATNVLPPVSLLPQQQISYEFGLDLAFFENRLGLDVTYYKSNTKDQIVDVPIPYSTGYIAKNINVGEISNEGFELRLTATPVQVGSFKWDIMGTFSTNKTIVETIAPDVETIELDNTWNRLKVQAHEGESFQLWGLGFRRNDEGQRIINETTGLFEFTTEPVPLGEVDPDFLAGITNSFSFNGITLSALVDMRFGGIMYSNTVTQLRYDGLAAETAVNRESTVINEGVNAKVDGEGNPVYVPNKTPVANMQQWWRNYTGVDGEPSIFDADYVKLREIRISYSLPSKLLRSTPFQMVEVAAIGRNLYMIHSKIPHVDPETSLFGAESSAFGVEWGGTPSTRNIGANVRITF